MRAQADQSYGLFISYRREDVPAHAGRLRDKLAEHFGESRVFMDVDSIGLGLDFVETLEAALATCELMLVIIGPGWVAAQDRHSKPRLDDPRDYVRAEIQTALQRGVRVVPVLVHAAGLPAAEDLPEPLAPLVRRQAIELSDVSFLSDTKQLIERLEAVVTRGDHKEPPVQVASAPRAAPASWKASLREQRPTLRRLGVTLSTSSHEIEYEQRPIRSNLLRVDGIVVGSILLETPERYEFSLADGSDTRAAVVEVVSGLISVKTVTLTVDGHVLYTEA